MWAKCENIECLEDKDIGRIHTHSPGVLHESHQVCITTGANFLELIISVS